MIVDHKYILENGISISSSGTSGQSIQYYQSPKKIQAANAVAINIQKIFKNSKIYTCCKITHAGGLLAQTVPALSVGADVDIENFSPYEFVKKISNYTHSHITPLHAKAIMLTKGFSDLRLDGIRITCGADPVTWDIIEVFVKKGAVFTVNWGMSEIGPIAINIEFDSIEKVNKVKNLAPSNSTVLGDTVCCQYKIINSELMVKGDICIYKDWYQTGDIVTEVEGILFYHGRKNIMIDINSPKKG